MSRPKTIGSDKAEFEHFTKLAEVRLFSNTEPKNGGASVAVFFEALKDVSKDYQPHMVISIDALRT